MPLLIEHLAQQTLASDQFELIFVDNGSTDRSREILSSVPGVLVLHEAVRDPYIARNRGIAAARGPFCVFLDADCLPSPDWLEQLAKTVPEQPEDIHLGYLALPAANSFWLQAYEHYYDAKLQYLIDRGMSRCYFGHGGNMVLSTKLFAEVGVFPPMPIVGDTEIIHRAIRQRPGTGLQYISTARVTHAEVTCFGACLRKIYETGQYSQRFVAVSSFSPVPMQHRIAILLECARRHSYTALQFVQACIVLASGWMAFALGRVRAWAAISGPAR